MIFLHRSGRRISIALAASAILFALYTPFLCAEAPEAKPPVPLDPSSFATSSLAKIAPHYAKYVEPGQTSQPLHWQDKLVLSGWEQVQPWSIETQFLSAGWEHLLDSNPRTGTDSGGFGEKLWMANVRQNSQAILSDGLFASIYHQDPRYYTMGHGNFGYRLFYAASRVFVTRGDNGKTQVNYSQLSGYAAAQILTRFYYPANGCSRSVVAKGYAISLSGAALGNGLHEFSKELLHGFHRRAH